MTFTISNDGCDPFSGDVTSPYSAFTITGGAGPFTLNPGDTRTITVTYEGGSCGVVQRATLDLGTGGVCDSYPVVGQGGGEACRMSVISLDFGDVSEGNNLDKTFAIDNIGCGPYTGTVSESCPDFSIVSGGGTYTIPEGGTHYVTVRFSPTSAGAKTCTIDSGCANVFCQGNGVSTVQCSLAPPSINFGTVQIGSYRDTNVVVGNAGTTGTLNGTIVVPSGGGCQSYSIVAGAGSYSLGPGGSHIFTVRYAPTECGTDNCTISTGCLPLQVAGEGIGGGCTVSTDSLDFGTLTVGGPSSADLSFTITNTGCTVLTGTVEESCLYYHLVGQVNYSLLPGESQTFAVRYMPEALGTHVCTIDSGAWCDIGIVCTGTLSGASMASMDVYTADPLADVKISLVLEKAGKVNLKIYDVAGRHVRTLESGPMEAGRHTRRWDRRSDDGVKVNAGIYFVELDSGGKTIVKKAVVLN